MDHFRRPDTECGNEEGERDWKCLQLYAEYWLLYQTLGQQCNWPHSRALKLSYYFAFNHRPRDILIIFYIHLPYCFDIMVHCCEWWGVDQGRGSSWSICHNKYALQFLWLQSSGECCTSNWCCNQSSHKIETVLRKTHKWWTRRYAAIVKFGRF